MHATPLAGLHRTAWVSLMAALMAVGSYLSLPIGPVPFTMQPFFVMLAGLVLGFPHALAAASLFVTAGLIGLPVFTGGKAGLAVLLGPTGGYLVGYILATAAMGLIARGAEPTWRRGLLAAVPGLVLLYLFGVLNLMRVLDIGWEKALTIGFLPFILQDIAKMFMAIATWRFMHARGLLPR